MSACRHCGLADDQHSSWCRTRAPRPTIDPKAWKAAMAAYDRQQRSNDRWAAFGGILLILIVCGAATAAQIGLNIWVIKTAITAAAGS